MKRARRPIDVLVNNAGVLTHGPFIGMPAARHQQLIDLNISGLTEMLAHFVPPMVARGTGRVLNVASIAAFQPVPIAGHLCRHQGLRAVADRVAVGRTARHRRDHHRAVPRHHRHRHAGPGARTPVPSWAAYRLSGRPTPNDVAARASTPA
jgi:NAD(P)-dependent dehydrogenase (short-subunit alcohol dehydrogenase family)